MNKSDQNIPGCSKKEKLEYLMEDEDALLTHEVYVSKFQAIELKKLGFNWHCYGAYGVKVNRSWILGPPRDSNNLDSSVCSAPTIAVAQRWLREVKGISVEVYSYARKWWAFQLYHSSSDAQFGMPVVLNKKIVKGNVFYSYEDALSAGIYNAIEFLKH